MSEALNRLDKALNDALAQKPSDAEAFLDAGNGLMDAVLADFAALRAERDAAVKRAEAVEALARLHYTSHSDAWPGEHKRLYAAALAAGCKLDGDA